MMKPSVLYQQAVWAWDQEIAELTDGLLQDPQLLRMRCFLQHGIVSTYRHSVAVARLCLLIARRFHRDSLDLCMLIRAALLHDYFLYDWHDASHPRWHGFHHPSAASENARHDFGITAKEQAAIESHMWPLTLFHIPRTREAWILTIADKLCSIWETVAMRGWR